jgi:hypothetical protein
MITIRTLEARIEELTGESRWDAEDRLEEGAYAQDKATENKLKTYLQRIERARGRLSDLRSRGIFDELELSKRAHLKECHITMKNAYYIDNENRRYCPWTYMTAIEKARELGCDGVVTKNTYDMGTPSLLRFLSPRKERHRISDCSAPYPFLLIALGALLAHLVAKGPHASSGPRSTALQSSASRTPITSVALATGLSSAPGRTGEHALGECARPQVAGGAVRRPRGHRRAQPSVSKPGFEPSAGLPGYKQSNT